VHRKLDQLGIELGESFSITFQTMISVLILTVQSFYYEWHTALVFLGNWPIAIIAGIFLQQVSMKLTVSYYNNNIVDGKATRYKEK